jgi:glycosyltransferase involved in cell wall biosynthesis
MIVGAASTFQAARLQEASPRILHLSADFPDPVVAAKTRAVQWLIDLTQDEFEHEVVSINRVAPRPGPFVARAIGGGKRLAGDVQWEPFPYGECLRYEAPPRGLFLKTCLEDVADRVYEQRSGKPVPDLVVGHKLTIEGLAVRHLARRMGVRYALGIMGDTDLKVLQARPDLAADYRQIFHEAEFVYALAPWALAKFEQEFGIRKGPVQVLPCATDLDAFTKPRLHGNGFVTAFHLRNHQRKNLKGLLAAMRLLGRQGVDTSLAVFGGGTPAQMELCKKAASSLPTVEFAGAKDRAELAPLLNAAVGFVLPSLRESFGMVYVEALFAGIPVIYPKGAGIDGYLDGMPFAIPVDSRDPAEIAAAMRTVMDNEASLKQELALWHGSNSALRFTRNAIGQDFSSCLAAALVSA